MTDQEVAKLQPGVYRVLWISDGGVSVAAVGMDEHGRHWLAPANWIHVPSFEHWADVDQVELLEEGRDARQRGWGRRTTHLREFLP